MSKVVMRYIGKDDYMASLKHGQLILVEEIEDVPDGGYYGINKYNEEIYIAKHEVTDYE